jgi:hypothetical protein
MRLLEQSLHIPFPVQHRHNLQRLGLGTVNHNVITEWIRKPYPSAGLC